MISKNIFPEYKSLVSKTIKFYKKIVMISRSNHQRCSIKKGVLRNFVKFSGKHLCQSLFMPQACNFIKKESLAQVFSCEFFEIFKSTFFTEHLRATASGYLRISFRCFPVNFLKFLITPSFIEHLWWLLLLET